jgi:AcrR family transcriptional regulator
MPGLSSQNPEQTARVRLRNDAIQCFGIDGFDAPVRAVAARASVSAGLVRHHFGSKEVLRDVEPGREQLPPSPSGRDRRDAGQPPTFPVRD